MSEPMTNIEIEDVLSSIRRLVSEDSAAARSKARPTPLILTPALRIAEPPTAAVASGAESVPAPDAGSTDATAQDEPEQETAALPDAVEFAAEADPDESPDGQADGQDLPLSADVDQDVAVATGALHAEDDDTAPDPAAGPDDMVRATADMPDDAPDVESTGAEPPAEAEALGPLGDAGAAQESDPARDEISESDLIEPTDTAAAEDFFAPRGELSLEDRIADLEAAIGQSDEEFEPDGSEDQAPHIPRSVLRPAAGTAAAEAWELRAEPPVGDLPEAPSALAEDDFGDDALGDDRKDADADDSDSMMEEALIDEDSLREIVADLVRQELRGELGERITRNVRRLIRREINRALALQTLDDED